MSPLPRRLTAILAAIVVALAATPATVLAQNGAGDEQYVDPLAGSGSGSSGGGGSGSSGSSGSHSGSSSGSTSGSSSGQVAPSTSPGTTSGSTSGTASGTTTQGTATGQLPRTGQDLRLPIGVGVVLLVVGLLLWRRRPGDGRA